MSEYLSGEAVSQVRNMLGASDGSPLADTSSAAEPVPAQEPGSTQPPHSASSSEPTTEQPAEVVKNEAGTEVVEARGDSASSAEDPGDSESSSLHRVPYARFKEVVDARNSYKGEVDSLRKQVEELSELMKRQQAQPAPASHNQSFEHLSDEDLLSLLDDSVDTHSEDSWQGQFQQMQQRMHQYEVANATQSLEREISQATSKYPVVPREALLQAVINDDSANLMEVAEQYSSFIASVEEAAIAKHMAQGKSVSEATQDAKEEVAQAVAPRPSRAASAPVNPPISAGDHKPKNLKDASKALRAFLQNSNPFA